MAADTRRVCNKAIQTYLDLKVVLQNSVIGLFREFLHLIGSKKYSPCLAPLLKLKSLDSFNVTLEKNAQQPYKSCGEMTAQLQRSFFNAILGDCQAIRYLVQNDISAAADNFDTVIKEVPITFESLV